MTTTPSRLDDAEFVRRFEDGSLEDFPHADHVRLTVIYLMRYPRDEAERRLADGIRRFAGVKGVPGKFHVTVTRAWVELIESARAAFPAAANADALLDACPALRDSRALLRFYSKDRLDSPEARTGWVEPDLAPIAVGRE